MDKNQQVILRTLVNPEFQKLEQVGGCKFHREGNAFVHSVMVYTVALSEFPNDTKMHLAALLHDIGKINHSHQKSDGDWEYPYHADEGARELIRFLASWDKDYREIQWYIRNHMKPLFWQKGDYDLTNAMDTLDCTDFNPTLDSMQNLIKLTICDLLGSVSETPDETNQIIAYLRAFLAQL